MQSKVSWHNLDLRLVNTVSNYLAAAPVLSVLVRTAIRTLLSGVSCLHIRSHLTLNCNSLLLILSNLRPYLVGTTHWCLMELGERVGKWSFLT